MNVSIIRPITVTPMQTAPILQVHTTASASAVSQVMEEIAQVINQSTKCPKTLSVQRVLIYALTNVLEYSDFLLKC
jgi:hypothetical protein